MPVVTASDNGGRYNDVHRQTDDGLVVSVAMGKSLMPLVFRYEDYLGHCQETLLSTAFFPHQRLMRGDCGWRVENDSDDILFSWQAIEEKTIGFSSGPSGEYEAITESVENCASDVVIDGLRGHRTIYYRKDREYWTPDKTLDATTPDEIFGWSQWNPNSCPPKGPNKCGIVQYPEGDCNPRKMRYIKNCNKTKEDKCRTARRFN